MALFITCFGCSTAIGTLPKSQINNLENPVRSEAQIISGLDNSVEMSYHAKKQIRSPHIEVSGGYFFFSDHTMRKVYNQGGEDVRLCFSYPLGKMVSLYGGIEYLERHGRSLHDHQRTRIEELPLSLGLKPIFPLSSWLDYYLSIGPRYTFIWVKNHSSYVEKTMHKSGFGGFAGTGFIFHPGRHWTLDFFGDYAYTRLHFHSSKHNSIGETRQVGGFTFGLGLGYQW